MRETRISMPELGLIAATRAALGVGVGLLLSDRLGQSERKAVGWTLVLVGALSTVPLAYEVFGGGRLQRVEDEAEEPSGDHWPGARRRRASGSASA